MKIFTANTRSKRAIAIDRSLQAKKVYDDFNNRYVASQNRSDVEEWDTRMKKSRAEIPITTPKTEPKKEEKINFGEIFVPNNSEKTSLMNLFYMQNPLEQFKDLQTTRNVVRTKKQLELWKSSYGKNGDVRGIDTQPEGYVSNRVKATTDFLGVPIINYEEKGALSNFVTENSWVGNTNLSLTQIEKLKKYKPSQNTLAFHLSLGKGGVFTIPSRYKDNNKRDKAIAHELGHQFDFKKGNYTLNPFRDAGYSNISLRFDDSKAVIPNFKQGLTGKLRVFNSRFGSVPYAVNTERDFGLKKGEGFAFYLSKTTAQDRAYRLRSNEQFAEFFSSFVTNKMGTKKYGKPFYNIFKSGVGKDLNKSLKQADYNFLKGFIGGSKALSFKI